MLTAKNNPVLLDKSQAIPYDLLLLADETVDAINKYVFDSWVYVLKAGKRDIAAFCLYAIDGATCEIKNIAVAQDAQGLGIGEYLLAFIKDRTKERFSRLIVGTPDSAIRQLTFYEKNGFERCGIRKDFYVKNYDVPIVENGVELRDMIVLEFRLSSGI